MKKSVLYLIGLLVINIFIKFYGIGDNSLWLDEAYSVCEASQPVKNIIDHSSQSDNPPGYYLALHYWTDLFGTTEVGVRSLSAVAAILSVLLLFVFALRNFGLTTALFSSILLTLSNQNLFYAQETRAYALVVLLVLLSIGFFYESIRLKQLGSFLGLFISNSILIYTHYLAICIPILEVVLMLIYFRHEKRLLIYNVFSFLLLIILFIPWIQYPILNRPHGGSFWLSKPNFSNFKGVFIAIANNKVALILAFGIFVFAFYQIIRAKMDKKVIAFNEISLLVLFALPILGFYLVAFHTPIFLLRYLLFTSIPFYLLVGLMLDKYIKNRTVSVSIFLLICISSLFSLKFSPTKDEDWKAAIEHVKEIRKDNDLIFLSADYTDKIFSYYFDKSLFLVPDSIRKVELKKKGILFRNRLTQEDYNELPNNKGIIAILSHNLDQDPSNSVMQVLSANQNLVDSLNFEKVKVITYRPN